MIRVRVTVTVEGALSRLEMHGHVSPSHGTSGSNLTCAAVTGLVRSCAEAIDRNPGLQAHGAAEDEGEFQLAVIAVAETQVAWLQGVTDVLLTGVRRLQLDTPGEIELVEETVSGATDGT